MNKEDFDLEVARIEKSKRLCARCDQLYLPEDLVKLMADSDSFEELETYFCLSCFKIIKSSSSDLCFHCLKTSKLSIFTLSDPESLIIEVKICQGCLDTILERNDYPICDGCEQYVKGVHYVMTRCATTEDPEEGINICKNCDKNYQGN